jgi:hypothetical protein
MVETKDLYLAIESVGAAGLLAVPSEMRAANRKELE